MPLASVVSDQSSKHQLFAASPQDAEASVNKLVEVWRDLDCTIVQEQRQAQLEAAEVADSGARQRHSKRA